MIDIDGNWYIGNGEEISEKTFSIRNPETQKGKRFLYCKTMDLILLKAVREYDAHIAQHGNKQRVFETVRSLFIETVPYNIKQLYDLPSTKSLKDRLTLLEENRRSENRRTEASSGINEDISHSDMLLDDLTLEKDDMSLKQAEEKGEKTNCE